MLIDLIPLKDVPKLLPLQRGKRITVRSVQRWARHGRLGIKLETRSIAGRLHTTEEWLEEWIDAVSAAEENKPAQDKETKRHAANAEAERLGI